MRTPLALASWAQSHRIAPEALADLLQIMVRAGEFSPTIEAKGRSEGFVQSSVRLEAPSHGVHLFRNNVGALRDNTGRPVRYGLANESKAENEVRKSADLVGWRSFVIEPRHVGTRIAQFTCRECKEPNWTWTGDAHETAQLNWALLVTAAGGDACFVKGPGSFDNAP